MQKTVKALSAAALALTFGLQAQAATVLLQDSFDSDSTSSVLNVSGLTNWTVDNGTVDYIRNGGFGLGCAGGSGGCIDMDGSRNDAGRIVSRATFALLPTGTYTIFFDVSGNQRGGFADDLVAGFIDVTNNTLLASGGVTSIAWNAAYQTYGIGIINNPAVVAGHDYRIFFSGTGGDNVGAILDNVLFVGDVPGNPVPEPGALALAALGLAAAVAGRRRTRPACATGT